MPDLPYLSAHETLALFRSRELSPVEHLDALIEHIERHDRVLNTVVDRRYDEARAEAEHAAGRYAGNLKAEDLELVERLAAFAGRRGRSILELAVSWLAMRLAVASVIAGATLPEQVKANAAAASWKLTEAELAEVEALLPPA